MVRIPKARPQPVILIESIKGQYHARYERIVHAPCAKPGGGAMGPDGRRPRGDGKGGGGIPGIPNGAPRTVVPSCKNPGTA